MLMVLGLTIRRCRASHQVPLTVDYESYLEIMSTMETNAEVWGLISPGKLLGEAWQSPAPCCAI